VPVGQSQFAEGGEERRDKMLACGSKCHMTLQQERGLGRKESWGAAQEAAESKMG